MIIRRATLNDAKGILEIRNNENIYKYFKNNNIVSFENHIKWLKNYLLNKSNIFLVSQESNGVISGYIRKDYIKNNDYEISIAISESFQKRGIAGKLLKEILLNSNINDKIYAEVYKSNINSINFFGKSGFILHSNKDEYVIYSFERKENILILTSKSWNIENYNKYKKDNWHIISNKENLTLENLKKINPKYIFIPHWSWIIKEEIWSNYNCIVFHMTDLPFGRGGSPLQNLIVNGYTKTKISAIKIDGGIDTGDIYLKENLSLKGTAEEILKRSSKTIYKKMIPKILNGKIIPKKQKGEIVEFKRRKEKDGEIKNDFPIEKFYDYIRMLDGEGYPNAFINFGDYKIEFSKAKLKNGEIKSLVTIKHTNEK